MSERPESWAHPYVNHTVSAPGPQILCLTQVSMLHMLPTRHKGGQSMGVYPYKSIIITIKKKKRTVTKNLQTSAFPLEGPSGSSLPGNESKLLNQDSPNSAADPSCTAYSLICTSSLCSWVRVKGLTCGPGHLRISIEFTIMSPMHFFHFPRRQLDKQDLKIILKLRENLFSIVQIDTLQN